MSCCGKNFEIVTWNPEPRDYSVVNSPRYGNFTGVPNYGKAYDVNMRKSTYSHVSISNPVLNYGQNITYEAPKVHEETHETPVEDLSDKLIGDLIDNLEMKINESKNGTRKILAVNY